MLGKVYKAEFMSLSKVRCLTDMGFLIMTTQKLLHIKNTKNMNIREVTFL